MRMKRSGLVFRQVSGGLGGLHAFRKFRNGFTASVIINCASYGHESGLLDAGVFLPHNKMYPRWGDFPSLWHRLPRGRQEVIGWLDIDHADDICVAIQRLPRVYRRLRMLRAAEKQRRRRQTRRRRFRTLARNLVSKGKRKIYEDLVLAS